MRPQNLKTILNDKAPLNAGKQEVQRGKGKYYKMGYDANKEGYSHTDNPYPDGTNKFGDWEAGWEDASQEIVQDLDL